eukprot:RCo017710
MLEVSVREVCDIVAEIVCDASGVKVRVNDREGLEVQVCVLVCVTLSEELADALREKEADRETVPEGKRVGDMERLPDLVRDRDCVSVVERRHEGERDGVRETEPVAEEVVDPVEEGVIENVGEVQEPVLEIVRVSEDEDVPVKEYVGDPERVVLTLKE